MKSVAEMQNERTQIMAEAEEILETAEENGRSPGDEETERFNLCLAKVEQLDVDIALKLELEAKQKASIKIDPAHKPAPAEPMMAKPKAESVSIPRSYGKMVAFPKTPEGEMRAFKAGQFIMATIYGSTKAADWCRQNGMNIRSALAGGINTAGGVLVPEEFERAIIDLREQYGVFRRLVRVRPMGSDTTNIPRRTGGLTAYYTGENTAGTESDATWDNVQLVAKKLMVLTRMSSEVSEDAIIDLADTMASEIAYAFALKEDTVGFTGTGISTDGGIVGVNVKIIDGNHTKGVVDATSATDTLPEIDAEDLINLMSVIPMYARAGSSWICSPTALDVVFNAIKVAGGGNTRDMLGDLDTPRFLGYPIVVTDIYPDNVATVYNNLPMIGFGNLGMACSLGDRRGIRVALSSEQYWEEDQIGVKGTMRHDINVHDLGSTTVKSPFAVLIGNT